MAESSTVTILPPKAEEIKANIPAYERQIEAAKHNLDRRQHDADAIQLQRGHARL